MTASTSKPRWRVWLLPALLVATTVAWGVLRWQLGTSVAVATVVQRDFVQTVVASGHVEAPHRVDIGAQITGTVVRVPVAEGQTVKAGEVAGRARRRPSCRRRRARPRWPWCRRRRACDSCARCRRRWPSRRCARRRRTLDNARAQAAAQPDLFAPGLHRPGGAGRLAQGASTLADAQVRAARKQLETLRPAGSDSARRRRQRSHRPGAPPPRPRARGWLRDDRARPSPAC